MEQQQALHDAPSEMSVLGAMILDNDNIAKVAAIITAKDFFLSRHGRIFDAAVAVHAASGRCDAVTLRGALSERGILDDCGGYDYLAELLQVPNAAAWEEYARAVLRASARRRALAIVQRLQQKIAAGHELNGDIEELEEASRAAAGTKSSIKINQITAKELVAQVAIEIDYIIQPFVSMGSLTILQGEPKGGKSCFALLVAICAAVGVWPCGRFSATKPRKTVFLSWEDGPRRIRSRIETYCLGMSCEPPRNLIVLSGKDAPAIKLGQGNGHLADVIRQTQAEFVVLDTLSWAHGAEENSKREMQPVMDELRSMLHIPCSILLVHHAAKPSEKKDRSIAYRGRGSSAIAAAADIILDWGKRTNNDTECAMVSKDDDSEIWITEYRKQDDDSVRWGMRDVEGDTEYISRVEAAIKEMCESEKDGIQPKQIVNATQIPKRSLYRILDSLLAQKRITMTAIDKRTRLYRPAVEE